MARIRTIKPEFWQDEDLATVSSDAKLLAIGLLNHADDEGYFKANPMLVKAAVFPFSNNSLNIHGLLMELSDIGYLTLFEGLDGKQYGVILKFTNHQVISRPSASKIKELKDSRNAHGAFKEDSIGKGKEGKGNNSSDEKLATDSDFENLWIQFRKELGEKGSKKKAFAAFKRLKPTIDDVQEMNSALKVQLEQKQSAKEVGQFAPSFPHVERWLRDERWKDEVPSSSSAEVEYL